MLRCMSPLLGPTRKFRDVRFRAAIGGIADVKRRPPIYAKYDVSFGAVSGRCHLIIYRRPSIIVFSSGSRASL
jgi:hypothetical protein